MSPSASAVADIEARSMRLNPRVLGIQGYTDDLHVFGRGILDRVPSEESGHATPAYAGVSTQGTLLRESRQIRGRVKGKMIWETRAGREMGTRAQRPRGSASRGRVWP